MTRTALSVSRHAPLASPKQWATLLGMPGGGWSHMPSNVRYFNGKTYIGYINPAGEIRVLSYTHASGAVTVSPAIKTGLTGDEHNAPGILIRSSDSKIVVAACSHDLDAHMYVAVSSNAEDVSAFGAASDISVAIGSVKITYPSLYQLSGESGKVYLFFRDQTTTSNYKWAYSTSTDGGATWSAKQLFFANGATMGYCNFDSDGVSRIDIAVSSDSPGSIYHFYYDSGNWKKSDGTTISTGTGSLPLAPASLTKIYDTATDGGAHSPAVLRGPYAVWTTEGTGGDADHWYAIYTGGAWSAHKIDDAGSPFTLSGAGGIGTGDVAIDDIDPTVTYLSRLDGNGIWQMWRYQTGDNGATWSSKQLTDSTESWNYFPRSPRNADSELRCVWMGGTFADPQATIPFTAAIRGYPNPEGPF